MESNYLENRKVIIRIIPERDHEYYKSIDKNHIGRHFFPDCKKVFTLPLSAKHNGLYRMLNKDEQKFFEQELELQVGELSFNTNKANAFDFWEKETVSLNQNDKVLDLSDAKQNLHFRILKSHVDEIAPSWEERLNKATYKWAIVDEEYQSRNYTKANDLKSKAYAELTKIKDNQNKLYDTLRLLGKIPAPNASKDWMYAELGKIVEVIEKVVGQVNIHDFLEVVEDKTAKTKLFIMDAIKLGEVTQSGTKYYIKGGDMIGKTLGEAVSWFDDNTNSELRKIIELRIKNNKD